ncbi:MAG: molybdopterin-dependent oxidoreductase [Actinomycetota bacterium]
MAEPQELSIEDYKKRSRRSFLTGGVTAAAGWFAFRNVQSADLDRRLPGPLRDIHELNESIWSSLFREDHLAQEFPISQASVLQINGRLGIRNDPLDLDTWQMNVLGPDGEQLGTHTLDDIKALPWHEMTIEHKCIEGWAQVTNWQGARFSDFLALYEGQLPDDITDVYLETPDGEYYVSVDMATMRHPQTLLAYDNFGEPISELNGAPLRLATPLKYGIKQIKRIGTIQFLRDQGGDYWGERGYDWYAGL